MSKQFTKTKQAAFGVAIAMSGAFLAPAAQASTVELAYEGSGAFGSPDWSRGVTYTINGVGKSHGAGAFRMTDTAIPGSSIIAWCLDLAQFLGSPVTYDTSASFVGSAEMTNIDRLFTSAYSLVVDADTAAAFQIALWEIITDTTDVDGIDLTNGSFITTGSGSHYDLAETYLLGLGSAGTGGYNLTTYFSATNQDLISATPVPLPATALLLLSGIFGAGAIRSRRKKA